LTTLSPEASGSGIVTFRPPEGRGEQISAALERARVLVTPRHGAIRVSAHVTTGEEEISALFEAIDGALGRAAPRRSVSGGASPPRAVGAPARRWRQAVVTGASRGLGAAFAAALARRGCSLTLVGRDRLALERLAEELSALHHVSLTVALLDLAEPDAVSQWIERNREMLSEVDLLINNAAWADASPFLDAEPAAGAPPSENNALAPMALARAVLPSMLARRYGNILNVVTSGARNAAAVLELRRLQGCALGLKQARRYRASSRAAASPCSALCLPTWIRRRAGSSAAVPSGSTSPAQAVGPRTDHAGAGQRPRRRRGGRSVASPAAVRWETAVNAALPEGVRARLRRS
jgi:NAD(P)-dependent dehydrogenase (short-subunit alcohol dehydrogenase family)